MAHTFNCPNCGGAIEVDGTQQNARCSYCSKDVPVPEEFWREAVTAQTTRRWGKYLLIFLAITVGVPACLGLFGALIGVAASILGALAPFFVMLFGN